LFALPGRSAQTTAPRIAPDRQADGAEDRHAQVEQHRTEVAQGGQADEGDDEADEAHQRLDAGGQAGQLRQRRHERTRDAGEGDQVERVAGRCRQQRHERQGHQAEHRDGFARRCTDSRKDSVHCLLHGEEDQEVVRTGRRASNARFTIASAPSSRAI
jgi:hypothetical protein